MNCPQSLSLNSTTPRDLTAHVRFDGSGEGQFLPATLLEGWILAVLNARAQRGELLGAGSRQVLE